jgi:flagellar biosynthetic protein FliP
MSTLVRGTAARCALLVLLVLAALALAAPAQAAVGAETPGSASTIVLAQAAPVAPEMAPPGTQNAPGGQGSGSVTLDLDTGKEPSKAIVAILMLTVLSLAPALLLLMTSFTRIVIVLSLTRNALGVQAIPPNQVIVGLSLFLSLFIMGPTLEKVNEQGIQPLLSGEKNYSQAYEDGVQPLRQFMLKEVKPKELALFVKANGDERPPRPEDVSMSALVPAFVLSEIKTAFIIGFVIFIPFLVIDIVIASSLMSMGMMMLPPVLISLPFKLLLFVMVDGWALVVRSLLSSYA